MAFKLSKTQIKEKTSRKTDSSLVKTIVLARKNPSWLKIAHIISGPTKRQASINLSQIDEKVKAGETILIPGKVLSQGDLSKKIKIIALSFSESAKDKIKKSKSEMFTIIDEIKKNPKAEGLKIFQ